MMTIPTTEYTEDTEQNGTEQNVTNQSAKCCLMRLK